MPAEAHCPTHGPCKVLIVDEHRAVRELLSDALRGVKSCHYQVVGLGGSGPEAVDLCRRLHPDVLVLEIVLPGSSGVEVLERLRREESKVRVVFFTGCEQIALVAQAVGLGASGYVLKSRPLDVLIEVIHRVCAGGRSIDPNLLREGGHTDLNLRLLTQREREVIRLIAQGKTTKEAAAALGLSAKTLDKHRSNLMRKLRLHDVVGLTHYAIASGMIALN